MYYKEKLADFECSGLANGFYPSDVIINILTMHQAVSITFQRQRWDMLWFSQDVYCSQTYYVCVGGTAFEQVINSSANYYFFYVILINLLHSIMKDMPRKQCFRLNDVSMPSFFSSLLPGSCRNINFFNYNHAMEYHKYVLVHKNADKTCFSTFRCTLQ